MGYLDWEKKDYDKEQGKDYTAELPLVRVLLGILTSILPGFRHRFVTINFACKLTNIIYSTQNQIADWHE